MSKMSYEEYRATPKFKETKSCGDCGLIKPFTDFYLSRDKDGYAKLEYRCKSCHKKISIKNKYKSLYNTSVEEVNKKYLDQKGKCAICKKEIYLQVAGIPQNKLEVAHVDHNHVTKTPRGLLCHCCNAAIGLLEDNVDNLQEAIAYLTKWKV